MTIVDPSGVPVQTHPATPTTSAGFDVAHDFDLRSGHGSVKVTVVGMEAAIMAITAYTYDTESGAMFESPFGEYVKVEDVVKLLTRPLRLMPAEAKMLGYMLICYGEEAIGNAITMRLLIEMGMEPKDAMQNLVNFGQGTRRDHAVAHARATREGAVEEKMDGPAKGGVS